MAGRKSGRNVVYADYSDMLNQYIDLLYDTSLNSTVFDRDIEILELDRVVRGILCEIHFGDSLKCFFGFLNKLSSV